MWKWSQFYDYAKSKQWPNNLIPAIICFVRNHRIGSTSTCVKPPFLISTQEFKIDFQNRKRNYQNKMELFIPLLALWSKNVLYKMFHIFTKEFEIVFQNRKWNYWNRKWNYFTHFQTSDKKISFTKCSSFIPRGLKLIFKTGNGIIQTGNGII